ncbi:MAG: pyridoxal phosphate-dependent aminotransferase [Neisseriaceae bacterium]
MNQFPKADKLSGIHYAIRGPIHHEAIRLEKEGNEIIKLNIGDPAAFGFEAPEGILIDVVKNLPGSQGYCDSKGLYEARETILRYYQSKGLELLEIEDIYIGNGVSELIIMSMQALLNPGDEVLVPMPDYPLWTAAVELSGGAAVHYFCDEATDWFPDIQDIKKKLGPNTRAIVIVNPNNPTGAVYSREVLLEIIEVARQQQLIILADEIYEKILFDDAVHHHVATLAPDILTVTMSGLSKTYRVAGFRQGWMVIYGPKKLAKDYIAGLDLLSSMRLCANVPMQAAIQTALGAEESIKELILPGGRLLEQRNMAYKLLNEIPGISCIKQMGALYCFPKLDTRRFHLTDDAKLVLDFLRQEKVLLVHGTGFNWPYPDHFRIVTLASCWQLEQALGRLSKFLAGHSAAF